MPPGRRVAHHAPKQGRVQGRQPAALPPGAIARRPPDRHPATTGQPRSAMVMAAPPAAAAQHADPAAGYSQHERAPPMGQPAPQAYRAADHQRAEPPVPARADRAAQLLATAAQSPAAESEQHTGLRESAIYKRL